MENIMKKTKPIDKVYLKLSDTSSAYSQFSTEENPSLNPEFADLITNLSNDNSAKNDIEINKSNRIFCRQGRWNIRDSRRK